MSSIAPPSVEDFKPIAAPVQKREQPHAQATSDDTPQSAESSTAPASRRLPDPPLRILLADDSADSRFLVCAYLKKIRCIIVEAANGRDAIDNFIAWKFDVVLMDLKMPLMDGYEATERIRAWEREFHRPPTPIIALTACVFDNEVQHAYEAGCDAHVATPVRKATLLEAIWTATNNDAVLDESRAARPTTETATGDRAIRDLKRRPDGRTARGRLRTFAAKFFTSYARVLTTSKPGKGA
jgi:CheY-like chemotaxis protein